MLEFTVSALNMVSGLDCAKRERAAFENGLHFFFAADEVPNTLAVVVDRGIAWSRTRYPLPKVERPRVVTDSSRTMWRVVAGQLQWAYFPEKWTAASDREGERMFVTAERIPLLANLLANPTELVDADVGGAQ